MNKINFQNLKILFPGKFREEKGTKLILKLFQNIKQKHNITLTFQQNFEVYNLLKKQRAIKINQLKNNLKYKDYLKSISKSDIVLLPYIHGTYKLRSSGIFVDVIKSNKYCFVSDNTWMSTILKKYKLQIFIITNWKYENLIKNLSHIQKNYLEINKKFNRLRKDLISNNSEKKFNKIMIEKFKL